jgi:hypothetical protein
MSTMPSNIAALEYATHYATGYSARQIVERGDSDGWIPVFDALQTTTTAPTTETAPTAALPSTGLIDLRGADGFALEVLGVAGSSANPFGIVVNLIDAYKAGPASVPAAYKYTQVMFQNSSFTIPTSGANTVPGALATPVSVGGITASHAYCMNLATSGGSTNFVSAPNTTSNRSRLHVWACGAPFAHVLLWRVSAAATHPTDLQAFYRPFVLGESRGSTLTV